MAHTQYGIGVTKNRFELFDDDDEDPLEVLKVREQEREARKKTKLSEKENKGKETSVKGKLVPIRKGIKETQNIKPQEAHKHKEDNSKVYPSCLLNDEEVSGVNFSDNKGAKFANRSERPDRRYNGDREERVLNRNRVERPPEERPNYREREERQFDRQSYREYRERAEGRGFYGGDGTDMRGRGRGGGSNRGGGGVSRGGGRGGRGGRPFDTRGKREYERQSGSDKTHCSGVKPVDKRDGSGAHNWGTHRDDLEDIHNVSHQSGDDMQQWTAEKPEEVIENNTATPGEGDTTMNPEEEPKELTLDEWKAMRGPRPQPVYNLRKAGEGEDLSQWKKMYALKKKEGDEDDEEEDDEYESCEYPQRVGRQKHVLDIDIHFKDARGRSRGGRGGGRGGPRPGSRINNPPVADKPADLRYDTVKKQEEPRPKKSAPKVDDEHDFPSLG